MKFFDSKYRLFGVINVIDLVVLFAIVVAGYAVYRVLAPKAAVSKGAAGSDVTFDVLCPSMRLVSADQIHVGDTLYRTTGKQIGTVTGVKVVPSPGDAWDPTTRKLVVYESNITRDVIISGKTRGQPTSNGLAVGDQLLHSGAPIPIMTSTFECDTAVIANMKINGQ